VCCCDTVHEIRGLRRNGQQRPTATILAKLVAPRDWQQIRSRSQATEPRSAGADYRRGQRSDPAADFANGATRWSSKSRARRRCLAIATTISRSQRIVRTTFRTAFRLPGRLLPKDMLASWWRVSGFLELNVDIDESRRQFDDVPKSADLAQRRDDPRREMRCKQS